MRLSNKRLSRDPPYFVRKTVYILYFNDDGKIQGKLLTHDFGVITLLKINYANIQKDVLETSI